MIHSNPCLPRRLAAGVLLIMLSGLVPPERPAFAAQDSQAPLDRLHSENPRVRRKAAADLGKSKGPDALSRLAELVRDPDVDVRMAVLRAIASLREIAGVPSMVVFLEDSDARIRSSAIDGAVEIYTHRDRPGVKRFLSIFTDGRDKREPLLVAPVDFQVYRSLAARLKDSDSGVRESAAEAIGILGGTEVVLDLVAALGDAAPSVRAAAVTAMVKVGTSADGEALVPLLKDSSSSVRRRAIEGLGRLKVVDSASDLRGLFGKSPDSTEGVLALDSLAELSLPADRPLFERLSVQSDPRKRKPGVEALARLGEKGNEARFKRAFQREKNEELRMAYAFALFVLGDRPFIDTVVLGLSGSRDRERQARGYIEELGARSLPEVLDYLLEPDPKIRAGLCDALSTAGVLDAVTAIEPLTRDKDQQVAKSAIRALAILKSQR